MSQQPRIQTCRFSNTKSNTKGNTMPNRGKPRTRQRSVKLYAPVEAAWKQLNQEDNFNYFVNYCLAEKMGLQIDLEPYRRMKGDD